MRVYIATALQHRARAEEVAQSVKRASATVVSTWHTLPESTIARERLQSVEMLTQIARTCRDEVESSAVLVWLYGDNGGRTGAAVEVGIGIHAGAHIVACPLPTASESNLSLLLYAASSWDTVRRYDELTPQHLERVFLRVRTAALTAALTSKAERAAFG